MVATVLPSTAPSKPSRGPLPWKPVAAGTAVVVALGVGAAVVMGGSSHHSPLAGLTGDQLQARTVAAANAEGAVRVSATGTDGTTTVTMTTVAESDRGHQEITVGGAHGSVVLVPGTVYLHGDSAALTNYFGFSAADAKVVGTHWLAIPKGSAGFSTVSDAVTVSTLMSDIELTGPLTVLPAQVRHGVRAVGVRGTNGQFGSTPVAATLWISDDAKALPVEFQVEGDTGVDASFAAWGHTEAVTAPTDVIATSKLQKATTEADAKAKSDLRNAATAEETWLTDNNVYTRSLAQLEQDGFRPTPGVTTVVSSISGTDGYCLTAKAPGTTHTWTYDSTKGGLQQDKPC